MAISNTSVANMAIDHCGGENIEALYPTDRSPNAQKVTRWFDQARREALEAYDWSFARRQKELALDAFDPPATWAFRYGYPADCLKARRIFNPYDTAPPSTWPPIPFEVIMATDDDTAKGILTNWEDAELVYTFDQINPEMWTPSFVALLSLVLADKVCFLITRSQKKSLEISQRLARAYMQLPGLDANEGQSDLDRQPEADSIRARL